MRARNCNSEGRFSHCNERLLGVGRRGKVERLATWMPGQKGILAANLGPACKCKGSAPESSQQNYMIFDESSKFTEYTQTARKLVGPNSRLIQG